MINSEFNTQCEFRKGSAAVTMEDISNILDSWPHDEGKLNVRIIEAQDGRAVLQLRIELGIVQMELEGRPDGVEQDGHPSLLELMETNGVHEGLEPETCRQLREEGVQRSHRAAALFALSKWELVIRDCADNLRLFDLCLQYAFETQDKEALEQFRPAVIALKARATAEWAISNDNSQGAIAALDAGLRELEDTLGDHFEESNEAQLLRGMKEALLPKLPRSERVDLQERLDSAIANENYELAAILRDEIRLLRD